MKAKQIGGGVLLASAMGAAWLVVAPPGSSDAGAPATASSAPEQRDPSSDTDKKAPTPPPSSKGTVMVEQPVQPAMVAAATHRPVTGGPRAYGYGVMDENGQVIPPPRPTVMTEVRPGMPETDTTGTERGHDRGPNFNLGLYRQADGSVYRP